MADKGEFEEETTIRSAISEKLLKGRLGRERGRGEGGEGWEGSEEWGGMDGTEEEKKEGWKEQKQRKT